jgi:hypothetical protein
VLVVLVVLAWMFLRFLVSRLAQHTKAVVAAVVLTELLVALVAMAVAVQVEIMPLELLEQPTQAVAVAVVAIVELLLAAQVVQELFMSGSRSNYGRTIFCSIR